MTDYYDGKWHAWNGIGDIPLNSNDIVEVAAADGFETDEVVRFAWHHDGRLDDIVAFRVVEKYAREFWIDKSTALATNYNPKIQNSEYIHVKEVL